MKCRWRYCTKETVPPFKSCPDCRAKVRAYSHTPEAKARRLAGMREREAELRAHGLCRTCKVKETWFESTRCRDCLDANAADRRRRRQERAHLVEAGKVCTQCTAHPPKRGMRQCKACLERQRRWHASWRSKAPDGLRRILEVLFDHPAPLDQLAEEAQISTRNALRNLQRLEREGKVTRRMEETEWSERAVYVLKLEVAG